MEEANAVYPGDPIYYEETFDRCHASWSYIFGGITENQGLYEDDLARYQSMANEVNLYSTVLFAALADGLVLTTAYLAYRKFCAR